MSSARIINSRYEIRDVVGRGGMGIVYKAFDRVVGREVALKTLGDIQGPVALDMFYKEWRLLANLHHPNIVEIFDIGDFEEGGATKPFFVMPLLPGATLEELLHLPGQPVTTERIVEIIVQTCRGLQALHENGLVHRDIKPSNIFVLEFNSVKLIDFGLVHLVGGDTATGIKGTVSYMSPEQVQGQECTAASDLFSLGVVCYEALTGSKPFQGQRADEVFHAILNHIPPAVSELNAGVSQMVSRAVHKALAKQPRHRYTSALEFAETLQLALRGEAVPALDPSRIQPRIQRAIRAFEQGRYEMAMEILTDLEAGGHIDPALTPLRNQIEQALRKQKIGDLLERARLGLAEDELSLALQNVEAALGIAPDNDDALKLRESIRGEIVRREVEDHLAAAASAIELGSFTRAKQLLQRVFEMQPDNARAPGLLQVVESREQAYRAVREEKEALYRAAKQAWQNAEFATAASKLRSVLALESKAPDTSSPDTRANYSNFLDLAESAQAAIDSLREQVGRCLEERRYEHGIALCMDVAAKYPGHPLPQGLRLLLEEMQKRDTLARMHQIAEQVEGERELERKLELLRQAADQFPNQPIFDAWARVIRERLALANAAAAKARGHDEHGRSQEAQEQWENVRRLYPGYPGLERDTEESPQGRAPDVPLRIPTPERTPTSAAAATASGISGPVPASRVMSAPAPAPPPRVEAPAGSSERQHVNASAAKTTTSLGEQMSAAGERLRSIAASARSTTGAWILRLRERVHHGGTRRISAAAGTAIAVLAILTAALVVTYSKGTGNSRDADATPPAMVRVVLRSATPGSLIRLNDASATDVFDLQTAPGVYQLEVSREGYESFREIVSVPPGGLERTLPSLRPLASGIRLSTDVPRVFVRLDGGEATEWREPEFAIDDLPDGDHLLAISDGQNEALISFRTAVASAPEILQPVQAKGLRAFAAGLSTSSAQVGTSGFSAQILLDKRPPDEVQQGIARFAQVGQGSHEVLLNAGTRDERRFSLEAGNRPTLWVGIYSDRNVGTLVVSAGLEQFTVLLNGNAVERRIRDGVMRIQNLAPRAYSVSVTAPGYDPAPEQKVEVRKGSEATAQFEMVRSVLHSQLALRGLPPKMQVVVDGSPAGTTDASGQLSLEKIEPGEHVIELKHGAEWKSVQAKRAFVAREAVTLGSKDFGLERAPATASIKVTPDNARVEWACQGGARQQGVGSQSISCGEGNLNLRVSAQGHEEETRTVALTAGGRHAVEFNLKRIEAARVKASCGAGDLASHGWKPDGDWFNSNKGASLPCRELPGEYSFAIAIPRKRAILGSRTITWSAVGGARADFELDDKWVGVRGQPKKNVQPFDRNGSITVRISLAPEQLVLSAYGSAGWQTLTTVPGDFRKARLEFGKDVRIASFGFQER